MNKSLIEVTSVTKKFGSYTVIDGVDFKVEEGSVLAIIGPNGSGKSTLVKILIGLEQPTKGSVLIDGKEPREQVRRIGYVPQSFPFDRSLPITVFEFLNIVPCPTNKHRESKQIKSALKIVGMEQKMNRRLGVLSGGELQRVLIARALLHERDILVLDEPSSGIDVTGEQEIYELLAQINKKQGTTIIVVSHEIDFVTRFATNVVCINRQMVCLGEPAEVLSAETIKKLYGNVKHYHHTEHHSHKHE